jgi:FkbM family methyltransferase
LPQKVLRQKDAIVHALALQHEGASRRHFLAQLQWRLTLDFDALPDADVSEQYLPSDIFQWRPNETFVDCGAFDGDTLIPLFRLHSDKVARVIAFEPDPTNVGKLQGWLATQGDRVGGRVVVRPMAVAECNKTVCFDAAGNAASAIGSGALQVPCVSLDSALAGETPTYIKMDIEGAEPDAITGALATIQRHRPILAVCIYHRQDHLWSIPNQLAEVLQDYCFFIRAYTPETWDLVLYAVPRGRLLCGGA